MFRGANARKYDSLASLLINGPENNDATDVGRVRELAEPRFEG